MFMIITLLKFVNICYITISIVIYFMIVFCISLISMTLTLKIIYLDTTNNLHLDYYVQKSETGIGGKSPT